MTAKSDVGALEASGLVGLAAMEPELEYLFRHVLVQDAAYSSLLKQERRELHRRVADALLQLYPGRRGELAGVVGMHLEEAGEPVRAAPFLVEAGEHALARFANREARAFFDRAYAALPAGEGDVEILRLRVRAAVLAVKAGRAFQTSGADIARLAELRSIADELGDPRLATDFHFWNALLRRMAGETPETSDELRRSTERLAELGAEHGDPVAQAMPQAFLGVWMVFSGQIRAGTALLERTIPPIEQAGDRVAAAVLYEMLTLGYARLGEFEAAERTVALAGRLAVGGDPIARLDVVLTRAIIASERGDLEDAVRLAGQCVSDAEELGATGCAIPANYFLGDGRLRIGDAATARSPFERALQLVAAEGTSANPLGLLAQAGLAATSARLGDRAAAVSSWQTSLDAARKLGDPFGEAAILARRAATLTGSGSADWPAVLADFEVAIRIFEESETRPALSRTLRAYAGALAHAGRAQEAQAARERAGAIAKELGLNDRDVVA